jgi:hypothetical protein
LVCFVLLCFACLFVSCFCTVYCIVFHPTLLNSAGGDDGCCCLYPGGPFKNRFQARKLFKIDESCFESCCVGMWGEGVILKRYFYTYTVAFIVVVVALFFLSFFLSFSFISSWSHWLVCCCPLCAEAQLANELEFRGGQSHTTLIPGGDDMALNQKQKWPLEEEELTLYYYIIYYIIIANVNCQPLLLLVRFIMTRYVAITLPKSEDLSSWLFIICYWCAMCYSVLYFKMITWVHRFLSIDIDAIETRKSEQQENLVSLNKWIIYSNLQQFPFFEFISSFSKIVPISNYQ